MGPSLISLAVSVDVSHHVYLTSGVVSPKRLNLGTLYCYRTHQYWIDGLAVSVTVRVNVYWCRKWQNTQMHTPSHAHLCPLRRRRRRVVNTSSQNGRLTLEQPTCLSSTNSITNNTKHQKYTNFDSPLSVCLSVSALIIYEVPGWLGIKDQY